MSESSDTDAVLRRLMAWAEQQEAVRALVLTSTRAIPGGRVDALSDYDVVLVVRDIRPFMADHGWPGTFGEVLVAYWDPVHTDPETGIQFSGNVVQYTDALKIDFTFWPVAMLEAISGLPSLPAELDAGYRVVVDKDGLASRLRTPTFTGYRLVAPDEGIYLTTVNDFFTGVPYVAKCLLRDEILPAKWCLDYDMRYVFLLPMLEWRVACDHGWKISSGVNGKGLKRYLPPEIWAELEGTYAGAAIEENWESLFRMIALFRRLGRDVAAHLGYTYPEELDARVTAHARRMRAGTLGIASPA